ncbi:MAG: hypothetical protein IPK65_02260 [Gammaproteobacteria bacterium]|nr:hypothetical protein [Gammaproteobacteria bacterium]
MIANIANEVIGPADTVIGADLNEMKLAAITEDFMLDKEIKISGKEHILPQNNRHRPLDAMPLSCKQFVQQFPGVHTT